MPNRKHDRLTAPQRRRAAPQHPVRRSSWTRLLLRRLQPCCSLTAATVARSWRSWIEQRALHDARPARSNRLVEQRAFRADARPHVQSESARETGRAPVFKFRTAGRLRLVGRRGAQARLATRTVRIRCQSDSPLASIRVRVGPREYSSRRGPSRRRHQAELRNSGVPESESSIERTSPGGPTGPGGTMTNLMSPPIRVRVAPVTSRGRGSRPGPGRRGVRSRDLSSAAACTGSHG
jgi:hypothetical protein